MSKQPTPISSNIRKQATEDQFSRDAVKDHRLEKEEVEITQGTEHTEELFLQNIQQGVETSSDPSSSTSGDENREDMILRSGLDWAVADATDSPQAEERVKKSAVPAHEDRADADYLTNDSTDRDHADRPILSRHNIRLLSEQEENSGETYDTVFSASESGVVDLSQPIQSDANTSSISAASGSFYNPDDLGSVAIGAQEGGGTVPADATTGSPEPIDRESGNNLPADDPSNLKEIEENQLPADFDTEIAAQDSDTQSSTPEDTDKIGDTDSPTSPEQIIDRNDKPTDIVISSGQEVQPTLVVGASSGTKVIGIYAPDSEVNLLDSSPDLTTSNDHHYFDHSRLGHTGYNYMGGHDWFQENGINTNGLRGGTIEFEDGKTGIIDTIYNGAGTTESAYVYYRAYDHSMDATVAENASEGQVVATLSTIDPDSDDEFTYSINDNDLFEIHGDKIQVKPGVTIDFETDTKHEVEVTVRDSGGNSFTKTAAINIADINEAPTDIALIPDLDNSDNLMDGASVGTKVVGIYAPGSDTNLLDDAPDLVTSNKHHYVDHGSLGHTGYNYMGGHHWFQDNEVSIRGLRGGTIQFEDGTTGIIDAVSNGTGSRESAYVYYRAYDPDANIAIDENTAGGTVVANLSTTDQDASESFTYAITDDPSGLFEIDGNQIKIRTDAEIDFEVSDSHALVIQVTDQAKNTYEEHITISVNDIDEPAPGQILIGTNEDDILVGSVGDDLIEGNRGNDTYVFNPFEGNDRFHGGEGGGWTDIIQLDANADPGANGDSPWTITIDNAETQYDLAMHALDLNPDTAGVITLSDGSELAFDGVERIEW